jgi:hypothetical protein
MEFPAAKPVTQQQQQYAPTHRRSSMGPPPSPTDLLKLRWMAQHKARTSVADVTAVDVEPGVDVICFSFEGGEMENN